VSRPRLALVPGEPAGVGPELCVRAAQRGWGADLVVFGDGDCLLQAAEVLGLPLLLTDTSVPSSPGSLPLFAIPNLAPVAFGTPDPGNAASVIRALQVAAAGCQRGEFDGLITGPVHKAAINDGGIAYTGTTELLAAQAKCDVVMMLANDIVRVALATTHLPSLD
jgi:4-hydroxythreonine-4-phosphate dehydrogenase